MRKFKIGDKVRIKAYNGYGSFEGEVGVINEITDGVEYPYSIDFEGINYIFCEEELELLNNNTNEKSKNRTFDTGANRDTAEGKFEYLGAINPLCDFSFAKYMYGHTYLPDGTRRSSDNWQKGFGKEVLIHSLVRHVEDLKLLHSGYRVYEERTKTGVVKHILHASDRPLDELNWKEITVEECCNAIRFNSEGYKLDEIKNNNLY